MCSVKMWNSWAPLDIKVLHGWCSRIGSGSSTCLLVDYPLLLPDFNLLFPRRISSTSCSDVPSCVGVGWDRSLFSYHAGSICVDRHHKMVVQDHCVNNLASLCGDQLVDRSLSMVHMARFEQARLRDCAPPPPPPLAQVVGTSRWSSCSRDWAA